MARPRTGWQRQDAKSILKPPTNVPGPVLGPPPFSAGLHPCLRVHASIPTPYKINVFSTRTFFLITKLFPSIILIIIKLYGKLKIHNTIMAVRDSISVKKASRIQYILYLIL